MTIAATPRPTAIAITMANRPIHILGRSWGCERIPNRHQGFEIENRVDPSDRIIDRDLNDRVPLLDGDPRLFGSLIRPVRRLCLPIHLQPELTALRSFALTEDHGRGLVRVGYGGNALLS